MNRAVSHERPTNIGGFCFMELFLSFTPSEKTREVFLDAVRQAFDHADGELHRYETLHSTLVYLGETDEAELPNLRKIVGSVTERHHALPVEGDRVIVSHDTSIYGSWGLLYLWKKTPEVEDLFQDMVRTLTAAGYLENYNRDYLLHSTLYMTYFPREGSEEWTPDTPPVQDCFDRVILYQVTTIDGHVAYYPLYEAKLK